MLVLIIVNQLAKYCEYFETLNLAKASNIIDTTKLTSIASPFGMLMTISDEGYCQVIAVCTKILLQ